MKHPTVQTPKLKILTVRRNKKHHIRWKLLTTMKKPDPEELKKKVEKMKQKLDPEALTKAAAKLQSMFDPQNMKKLAEELAQKSLKTAKEFAQISVKAATLVVQEATGKAPPGSFEKEFGPVATPRTMRFPYTFTAKIVQFPWIYYVKNNWVYKYYAISIVLCLPIFKKISNVFNSPTNVKKWKEIKRKEREAESHH